MPSARLTVELGKDTALYARLLDKKTSFKRSRMSYKKGAGRLEIEVQADDHVALVASLSYVLKQLRVIASVEEKMAAQDAANESAK